MTEATEHDVTEPVPALDRFSVPHDWAAIDEAVTSAGGAVVKGLLGAWMLDALNDEIDAYMAEHVGAGTSATGSDGYDLFLGHRTIRLHGLIEKLASGADLIGMPELVGWANRHIAGGGESVILNAAELIQIQPGEPAQSSHRDTDSWPIALVDGRPVIVNAIAALDDFTLDNGATYVAPGSWAWDESREATDTDWTRAVMDAGDVLLFRGDAVHRGGEEHQRRASSGDLGGVLRRVVATGREQPPQRLAIGGRQDDARRAGVARLQRLQRHSWCDWIPRAVRKWGPRSVPRRSELRVVSGTTPNG